MKARITKLLLLPALGFGILTAFVSVIPSTRAGAQTRHAARGSAFLTRLCASTDPTNPCSIQNTFLAPPNMGLAIQNVSGQCFAINPKNPPYAIDNINLVTTVGNSVQDVGGWFTPTLIGIASTGPTQTQYVYSFNTLTKMHADPGTAVSLNLLGLNGDSVKCNVAVNGEFVE